MTDYLKPSNSSLCVETEAMKELRKSSTEATVLEAVKAIEDGVKSSAERFNMMRATFSEFIKLLQGVKSETKDFVVSTVAIRHGDYGILLDSEKVDLALVNVEDAGLFTETMRYIASRKAPSTRIRACVEANNKITEAIDGWTSKIDKMRMLSRKNGSSEAEINAANKKIVQFEEAVKVLKKRGGQVSDAFFATIREIEKFVADAKKEFKVVYFQESAGKDKE